MFTPDQEMQDNYVIETESKNLLVPAEVREMINKMQSLKNKKTSLMKCLFKLSN